MTLPTDPKTRKESPVCMGLLRYFPDAIWQCVEAKDPTSYDAAVDTLLSHVMSPERDTYPTASRAALWLAQAELDPGHERARKSSDNLLDSVLRTFPDAVFELARLSKIGNDQHNPGEPMHWAKEKSKDHEDTIARHLMESGTVDSDGVRHIVKVAWRTLAMHQTWHEETTTSMKATFRGVAFPSPSSVHDMVHRT